MGKKRRLKSAKMKFEAKHSNHPRMMLLEDNKPEVEEPKAPPQPEVVLREEKIEAKPKSIPKPKAVKKPKAAKKPKRPTTKKTTKKTSQATA